MFPRSLALIIRANLAAMNFCYNFDRIAMSGEKNRSMVVVVVVVGGGGSVVVVVIVVIVKLFRSIHLLKCGFCALKWSLPLP